jgi:hypothetical protein
MRKYPKRDALMHTLGAASALMGVILAGVGGGL